MADNGSIDIKDQARRLVEKLPADATWDDLMHQVDVRQAIESGVADTGRTRRCRTCHGDLTAAIR
jgi:hypothetical protein